MKKPGYSISVEQVVGITDVELAFSTDRLLPAMADIPPGFINGNEYTSLVEAVFYGQALPEYDMAIMEGVSPQMLNKVIRAHLQSFGSKHEHKIAGVGFMLSKLCVLNPLDEARGSSATGHGASLRREGRK